MSTDSIEDFIPKSPEYYFHEWVTALRSAGMEPRISEMTDFLPLIPESLITFTLLQRVHND
jgi:hypothetical protein